MKPLKQVLSEAASDVHSDLEKIGLKRKDNWMYDAAHEGSANPEKVHKVLEKHGFKMTTHYRGGHAMPKYNHWSKDANNYGGKISVNPTHKDGKITYLSFKGHKSHD